MPSHKFKVGEMIWMGHLDGALENDAAGVAGSDMNLRRCPWRVLDESYAPSTTDAGGDDFRAVRQVTAQPANQAPVK